MSQPPATPPIPARFYPAGGDAHGHPARLELAGGVLQVLLEDGPPHRVPLAGLRAATRGFNHSQWAIAWAAESAILLIMKLCPHKKELQEWAKTRIRSRTRQSPRFVRIANFCSYNEL